MHNPFNLKHKNCTYGWNETSFEITPGILVRLQTEQPTIPFAMIGVRTRTFGVTATEIVGLLTTTGGGGLSGVSKSGLYDLYPLDWIRSDFLFIPVHLNI